MKRIKGMDVFYDIISKKIEIESVWIMFMYEIVECYSMSTSSIILISEEEYSMEEFQNICNSIKNEEGYNKNYTQRHIIERL